MKQINKYICDHFENDKFSIIERLHINKDTGNRHYNYHPKTRDELEKLIYKLIKERGNEANLNDIDTSEITDMNYMFYWSEFNGDISDWDVSNVKDMECMFGNSYFNGDISKWDVSNVEDMRYMFFNSKFNRDISTWNVSNVKYMMSMFNKSSLEKNPPKWYKKK